MRRPAAARAPNRLTLLGQAGVVLEISNDSAVAIRSVSLALDHTLRIAGAGEASREFTTPVAADVVPGLEPHTSATAARSWFVPFPLCANGPGAAPTTAHGKLSQSTLTMRVHLDVPFSRGIRMQVPVIVLPRPADQRDGHVPPSWSPLAMPAVSLA